MWGEIVGWMVHDGELLRASTSRFLERAGVPFLREVVVYGSSRADSVVNPARVGISFVEERVRWRERGGER